MRNKSMIRRLMLVLLVVSVMALCHAPVVHAAALWIGTTNNFNDPANWVDDDSLTGPKNPDHQNGKFYVDGAGYLNNIDITADISMYSLGMKSGSWGSAASDVTMGSTGGYTLTFVDDTGLNNDTVGTGTLTVNSNINMGNLARQYWWAKSDIVVNGSISSDSATEVLDKGGWATMYFNGVNTYTGNTKIGEGTMGGTGTLASAYTQIYGGCTISPGFHGVGTLTVNDLQIGPGAYLDFELGAIGASDLISMSSSTLELQELDFAHCNFTALAGFGGGVYTLIDADSVAGWDGKDMLGTSLTGMVGGLEATLGISGGDLILTVVPEPSTVAMLLAGIAGMMACAWRRRK